MRLDDARRTEILQNAYRAGGPDITIVNSEPFFAGQLRQNREFMKSMLKLVAGLITLCSAGLAYAQSCAMCYNSAAAAKASAIQALKHGILVLLIPPLAMFIGIFGLAFRRRNRFHEQDRAAADGRYEAQASEAEGTRLALRPGDYNDGRSQTLRRQLSL